MKAFLVCTLLFAFCSWCVQLGGLAALHHDCNNVPATLERYAQQQNLTHASAIFDSITNFNDVYNYGYSPRCSVIFGLQWWITMSFLFILIGVALCIPSAHVLRSTGSAWGMFLAVVSAVIWLLCQRYNAIHWNLHNVPTPLWLALGVLKTPLEVTYAGYILEAISAGLLFFGLNAAMCHHKSATPPPPPTTWGAGLGSGGTAGTEAGGTKPFAV